jgi:hypothetical protein
MASEYQYHVDPKADRKLAGHLEFLARASEKAAIRLYKEYKGAIEFIESNAPGCPAYTLPQKTASDLRYKLFGKRYRIVFEIDGGDAYAYDIQDCRQDTENNLV